MKRPSSESAERISAKGRAAEVFFADRAQPRTWLCNNHASSPAIWLVYDKKSARVTRALSYDQIVEEALCFGWIDGVSGRVDAGRAKLYFCRRKKKSVWSALNKRRLIALAADGLITPAGRGVIDAAKQDGSWTALDAVEALTVPADLAKALKTDAAANGNFEAFPPGVKKQILRWVTSAKRAATRDARVAETLRLAAKNERANQPNADQPKAKKNLTQPSAG